MTKEFDIVELRGEEGFDLGSGINYSMLPTLVLRGGKLYH